MALKDVTLSGAAALFLVSSLISFAAADTCSTVASLSNLNIKRNPELEYTTEQTNYWSTGCGALKPSCILYPSTSGGHNPNAGFASIDGGPLISTKYLNEVSLDRASMTVRVGPGNDWEDIHKVLDGTGVDVVGGRIGEVGVGGYVIGGGLSFLSTQYGWAANNIVEFEVVLANATIVTASETEHSDLFKALKGGGNNYGIVTNFRMVAHPIGQVWGGNLVFPGTKSPEMLEAVRNFTANHPEKAGIIMTAELTALGAVDIWIMFLFWDGPTPPEGTFDLFTNIGPISNDCKTRSYYDLLSHNDFAVVKGSIYTITTETLPLPDSTVAADVLGAIHSNWRNVTQSVIGTSGLIGSIAYQPLPRGLARKAREAGGDMLDLDDDVDRLLIEFNYSYWLASDDAKMDAATRGLYEGTREVVERHTQNGDLPDAYVPLFMNDAYFRQDYFGRLRTADFARMVREAYDPEDFFKERTKGWKM
ncbi:FAD-binding domain-containing protein [Aaosphaeria arxii CBS 175.79]|uniref:FAD-binding domain-containing protein n=1 Tax=Aaosphaeria arxii CBS 175.79 TaxID=1450172 RepID=A0A6A5Y8E6_9PLEO|nr:FAD-binding domain-containing protein [Aaosphaeria arxii CBS 175.79]KAF2021862.1 FAD-binding domain-containing protein [Aaosphaeria arxii CBS 175.79]